VDGGSFGGAWLTVLQHNAATAALALLKGQQSSTSGSLKYVVDAFAAQAGAFKISLRANFPSNCLSIMFRHKTHRLLAHFLDRDGVLSKIFLKTNENNGNAGAQAGGFLNPLHEKHVSFPGFITKRIPHAEGAVPCA
jgi:hypothetical protein